MKKNGRRKRRKTNRAPLIFGLIVTLAACLMVTAFLISGMSTAGERSAAEEMAGGTVSSVPEIPEVVIPDNLEVPEKQASASTDHFAWIAGGKLGIEGAPIEGQETALAWENLKQVAVADDHVIGLDADATAHAVGNNASRQCGLDGVRGYIAVAAGLNCSAAVFFDGTIHVYGPMKDEVRDALLLETDAKDVAFGEGTVVVLRNDGTVMAAGDNEHGECEVGKWKDIVMIAAGTYFTAGLKKDGTVVIAGDDTYGQKQAEKWSGIRAIAAGGRHIAGIREDGTVLAAGRNDQGECAVGDWKDVTAVACGYDHTLGITVSGEVLSAGYSLTGASAESTEEAA